MKATKKIVAAACALVAAVALSAGSTFAWFLSSSSVDAKGLTVQATVPTSLYIENGYHSDYTEVGKRSITMTEHASTRMYPAAISTTQASGTDITEGTGSAQPLDTEHDGNKIYAYNALFTSDDHKPNGDSAGTPDNYELIATGSASATSLNWVGSGTATADTKPAGEGGYANHEKEYVVSEDMTVANLGATIARVDALVDVTWPNETGFNTYQFIRVGFVVSTDGTSYNYYSLANTSGDNVDYSQAGSQKLTFKYESLITNLESNKTVTISLLVWFDGNDADCKVKNASVDGAFTINVTYKAVDTSAPGGPGA